LAIDIDRQPTPAPATTRTTFDEMTPARPTGRPWRQPQLRPRFVPPGSASTRWFPHPSLVHPRKSVATGPLSLSMREGTPASSCPCANCGSDGRPAPDTRLSLARGGVVWRAGAV
jgi:hypothetical protein